jgi:tRNA pseudouridine38-40 synthase
MPRRNFLITLAYDGAGYEGWQRLPGEGRSVQGWVEAALAVLVGEAVEITGAGRTDRGVHAEGQAASFHSRTDLAPEALLEGLRRELPPDIVATSCREVEPRFHARYRVRGKTYRYRLHVAPEPDPALRPYSHHVRGPLDFPRMRQAARLLEGEHDYAAFTNTKEGNTSRAIDSIRIESEEEVVDIFFVAKGFLYNQVRIMAASILAVGEGRLTVEELARILASKDRSKAPGALGAYGLCLMEVKY